MKDKVQPDIVTQELKKGFEWTTSHSKLVLIVIGALLVAGGAGAAYNFVNERKETLLQEKYFVLENDYEKKKEQFELFTATSNQPVDPKTKAAPKAQGVKATGDLAQDYGTVEKGLRDLINEAPSSRAGAMSALLLTDLYKSYNKAPEALEVLKKTSGTRGTMGALVKAELGTQMADQKDCEGAIKTWSDLSKDKSAAFMASQLKLKMGLCAETLGKKNEAEDYYKQVIADAKDSTAGRSAEKLLRLLQSTTTVQ